MACLGRPPCVKVAGWRQLVGSDSTFTRGDRVDRFEIDALIAEGGMGAVYRAVDTKLQRTIALKVVRAEKLGSSSREQVRQRFLREALAISKVDHRNVVRVLDFGYSGDTPYLAMEYLRGRDLGKLIKSSTALLPVTEVADIMLSVCAAIRACHDAGIIHRDLKPSNIFLCDDDSGRDVKILDFGVAKPEIPSDLTREGQIVGTPQYLAPEQVDGRALPQTDQYAIGVVLYVCLTKTLPYQNHASFGLLRAIVLGKFTPPRALRPDLPEKLEEIILRAMRIAPEERFESAHALGRELWEFASPDARNKWRSYFLDDRLKAPPKASTHAMPLIEAMARGLAAAAPPPAAPRGSTGFATTVPATPATPAVPQIPVTVDEPAVDAPSVDASSMPSTASAAEARPSAGPATRRSGVVLAAGGAVAALAIAGWLALKRPGDAKVPAAAVPVAPSAPAPQPVPIARPAQASAPADRFPAPRPTAERAPRPPAPARVDKRRRRNHERPTSEQTADGVPIMP